MVGENFLASAAAARPKGCAQVSIRLASTREKKEEKERRGEWEWVRRALATRQNENCQHPMTHHWRHPRKNQMPHPIPSWLMWALWLPQLLPQLFPSPSAERKCLFFHSHRHIHHWKVGTVQYYSENTAYNISRACPPYSPPHITMHHFCNKHCRPSAFNVPFPNTNTTTNGWELISSSEKKRIAFHYGCGTISNFEDNYLQLGNELAASEYSQFVSEAEAIPPSPSPVRQRILTRQILIK